MHYLVQTANFLGGCQVFQCLNEPLEITTEIALRPVWSSTLNAKNVKAVRTSLLEWNIPTWIFLSARAKGAGSVCYLSLSIKDMLSVPRIRENGY